MIYIIDIFMATLASRLTSLGAASRKTRNVPHFCSYVAFIRCDLDLDI